MVVCESKLRRKREQIVAHVNLKRLLCVTKGDLQDEEARFAGAWRNSGTLIDFVFCGSLFFATHREILVP